MSEIRVLDKKIAELIAAGEVIERPASIVKELLENSIDAGATHITIEIKSGGVELIRVTDDGKGIAPEDAETAFLRHATSKVKTAEDLNEIFTLGFRGEALASICAVSRVSMLTRKKDSEIGCHIEIAGGELIGKEEAGCPVGTTIIVKNIFYNTPARMKFLKKDVSEANAVASIVEKIAVSNPSIAFKFIRDGKLDIQTVGDGKLFSAIHSVFGKPFADTLLPVESEKNGVKVSGFISKAQNSRAKRGMQYFFLNGRTVKNVTMMVALEEAYKGAIMVGKFPACVLMVDISPSIVDINVHPTKTEVRFSDERVVYDAVYFACKSALSCDSAEAEFKFKENPREKSFSESVKFNDFTLVGEQTTFKEKVENLYSQENDKKENEKTVFEEKKTEVIIQNPFANSSAKIVSDIVFNDKSIDAKKSGDVEIKLEKSPVFESHDDAVEEEKTSDVKNDIIVVETISENNNYNTITEEDNAVSSTDDRFSGAKVIGELFKTYIMLECDNALYLVDKHAAHERLIYDKLKASAKEAQKQYLLESIVCKLSREEYDALMQHIETVSDLGFEIDDFGNGSVIIRAIPPYVSNEDAISVVSEIASNLQNSKKEITPKILDDIYHTIACRSAVKANDKSSNYELSFLVECLKRETDVKHCPHGRPVTVKISKSDIEKRFGRIQ